MYNSTAAWIISCFCVQVDLQTREQLQPKISQKNNPEVLRSKNHKRGTLKVEINRQNCQTVEVPVIPQSLNWLKIAETVQKSQARNPKSLQNDLKLLKMNHQFFGKIFFFIKKNVVKKIWSKKFGVKKI